MNDESGERPHDGILGVQFEPDAAMAAEMAGLAARYVERGNALKVALDFSDASIETADRVGLQMYEALPQDGGRVALEERRSALASELGAYFGETFIKITAAGGAGWPRPATDSSGCARTPDSPPFPSGGRGSACRARRTTALPSSMPSSRAGRRNRLGGGRTLPIAGGPSQPSRARGLHLSPSGSACLGRAAGALVSDS